MLVELWNFLAAVANNERVINGLSLFLGTLAALYGYKFLGKRSGLLRQLLVALPAALTFAAWCYIVDVQSDYLLSDTLRVAVGLSGSAHSPLILGIMGFACGVIGGIGVPDLFRTDPSRRNMPVRSLVVLVSSVTFIYSVILSIALEAEREKYGPIIGHRPLPPTYRVVIIDVLICLSGYLAHSVAYLFRESFDERVWMINILGELGAFMANLTVFISAGIVVQVFLYTILIPAVGVLAWGGVVGAFIGIEALVLWLQNLADELPKTALQYISLAFLLAAALLQFYEQILR